MISEEKPVADVANSIGVLGVFIQASEGMVSFHETYIPQVKIGLFGYFFQAKSIREALGSRS